MEKPKRFRQTAPDQMEIREGGGCLLSLFGLIFLAPRLFFTLSITLIWLGVVPIKNAAEVPWWSLPPSFVMGLVFFAAGGWFLFGRSWILIDVSQGRIQKMWGLLTPMQREDLSLHDYRAVALRREVSSESMDGYPVVLLPRNTSLDITLCTSTDYSQSREEAMFLAQFLSLPLEDLTTDHKIKAEEPCSWPGFPLDRDG